MAAKSGNHIGSMAPVAQTLMVIRGWIRPPAASRLTSRGAGSQARQHPLIWAPQLAQHPAGHHNQNGGCALSPLVTECGQTNLLGMGSDISPGVAQAFRFRVAASGSRLRIPPVGEDCLWERRLTRGHRRLVWHVRFSGEPGRHTLGSRRFIS